MLMVVVVFRGSGYECSGVVFFILDLARENIISAPAPR